jgi:hypothetical protein
LFSAQTPLPLARTSSGKEIDLVLRRLDEMGVRIRVVKDDDIDAELFVKRLRRIDFVGEKLILTSFNDNEALEVNAQDLNLIVVGAIFEQKVQTTEKYSKKSESEILDASQTSSDKAIIDIFLKNLPYAFRVSTHGVDFSCLGKEKGMLAAKNIKILIEKLSLINSNVKVDSDYLKVRRFLTSIWKLDEQINLKGIKRKGLNSFNRNSITTTTNLAQFGRYSRLRWYLINEIEKKNI